MNGCFHLWFHCFLALLQPPKSHTLSLSFPRNCHLGATTMIFRQEIRSHWLYYVVHPLRYHHFLVIPQHTATLRTNTQAFLWASFVLSSPWTLYCLSLRWLLSSSRLGFAVEVGVIFLRGSVHHVHLLGNLLGTFWLHIPKSIDALETWDILGFPRASWDILKYGHGSKLGTPIIRWLILNI